MSILWNAAFLFIFGCATLLGMLFTWMAKNVACKFGVYDEPKEGRLHSKRTPLLGGLGIALGFSATIAFNLLLAYGLTKTNLPVVAAIADDLAGVPKVLDKLLAIIFCGWLIFILGLVDDLKGLSPKSKLLGQIVVALIVVLLGVRATIFIKQTWIAGLLTVAWIVLITNSFNLLDNMDGLAGGIAAIAASLFFATAYMQGQYFVCAALAAFVGALLGFLRYNLHPAQIFMGDAGSMFVGFWMGVLTVLNTYYNAGKNTPIAVAVPLLILGVPIFDTITVVLIRMKERRPIFAGDTNHFSHRMMRLGMSYKGAVGFVYLVSFIVGLNALLVLHLSWRGVAIALLQAVGIFLIIWHLEQYGRSGNM